ncbi:MAG: hypothetical protein U1F45_04265 [Burkholderiales bacterium]
MAQLIIADLPVDRALDRAAMAVVRGGLSWVNGAFALPLPPSPPVFGGVQINNIYQTVNNNLYQVEEMVNHYQIVNIDNQGPSANITAVVISSLANGGLDFRP